jgi:DNA-binding HxlR family transcriptional regulator
MRQSKVVTKESAATIGAKYCPYCGGSNVSSLKDKTLCLSCGASFVAARVSQGPETRRPRPAYAFGTRISTMQVLPEQTAVDVSELDKALDNLDVSVSVRELARAIYRKAATDEISHDEISRKALASAAIYAACKQGGLSKSLDEIAAASGVGKADTEHFYTFLLNEMGYLSPLINSRTRVINEPEMQLEVKPVTKNWEGSPQVSNVERFLEKKGTYEFLGLLKESPRRWKTLEKELALSPRTLSERITQALELGFIEKVRRLKIGATYYRLTKKGNEMLEAMTENTSIY